MNNYIIINADTIQKRIEELKDQLKTLGDTYEEEIHAHGFISGEINQLEKCLSQSTDLIPEIEKAFDAGVESRRDNIGKPTINSVIRDKKEYISNLKLDI